MPLTINSVMQLHVQPSPVTTQQPTPKDHQMNTLTVLGAIFAFIITLGIVATFLFWLLWVYQRG